MSRFRTLLGLVMLSSLPATADNVITVTGTVDPVFGMIPAPVAELAFWTQTTTFSNMTISATLNGCGLSDIDDVYLTNNFSPAASVANEIARGSVLVNGSGQSAYTLFTGLTLGPGTYYLTVVTRSGNKCGDWDSLVFTPFQPTDTYPPASVFALDVVFPFSVTGTPTPTPTPIPGTPIPPTAILGLTGLAALGLTRLRRFHR